MLRLNNQTATNTIINAGDGMNTVTVTYANIIKALCSGRSVTSGTFEDILHLTTIFEEASRDANKISLLEAEWNYVIKLFDRPSRPADRHRHPGQLGPTANPTQWWAGRKGSITAYISP